jgi:gamma-butyrobetaine dioxygenase
VTFAPDQHRSAFPRTWLEDHALGHGADGDGRTEDDKELWLPADLGPETGLPAMSWSSYLAGGKAEALEAVLRVGFVLLSGLTAVPGRVLEVAASFGYVRETNYGRLFDVRVEPAPGNLAFTSRAIRPHTDNPYRVPAPTVQLLHCLRAAGEGGDTGLVDGFAAAADFRAANPESFGTLARTPVPFGYVDKETELRASLPLVQLSPSGRSAGSASTTGRCGRCGGRTPRSPRSTPPTGGG